MTFLRDDGLVTTLLCVSILRSLVGPTVRPVINVSFFFVCFLGRAPPLSTHARRECAPLGFLERDFFFLKGVREDASPGRNVTAVGKKRPASGALEE